MPVLVYYAGAWGGIHFPITKGNPLLASNVIKTHPELRLYIENADLLTITWIIP